MHHGLYRPVQYRPLWYSEWHFLCSKIFTMKCRGVIGQLRSDSFGIAQMMGMTCLAGQTCFKYLWLPLIMTMLSIVPWSLPTVTGLWQHFRLIPASYQCTLFYRDLKVSNRQDPVFAKRTRQMRIYNAARIFMQHSRFAVLQFCFKKPCSLLYIYYHIARSSALHFYDKDCIINLAFLIVISSGQKVYSSTVYIWCIFNKIQPTVGRCCWHWTLQMKYNVTAVYLA